MKTRTAITALLAGLFVAAVLGWFVFSGRNVGALSRAAPFLAPVILAPLSWMIARAIGSGRRAIRKASEKAQELGLSYEPKTGTNFTRAFAFLPEIKSISTANHIMRGELAGRGLTVFQSTYRVHTGQSVAYVSHTIYASEAPHWPKVHIVPRVGLRRLFFALGRRSGLLLDDPTFNANFRVRTDDEDFAITLLTPSLQRFMLGKRRVAWRIGHGHVCLVYPGNLHPDRMEASLARLEGFWSHVARELESFQPAGPDQRAAEDRFSA